MEEETWLRNEMDGRIRVLLNQKNLRRIDQICEMGKHGERTPPQSLGIQRLHANEESVRVSKTSNENVHLFSYSTEQFELDYQSQHGLHATANESNSKRNGRHGVDLPHPKTIPESSRCKLPR